MWATSVSTLGAFAGIVLVFRFVVFDAGAAEIMFLVDEAPAVGALDHRDINPSPNIVSSILL